jgi:hypothetical protein
MKYSRSKRAITLQKWFVIWVRGRDMVFNTTFYNISNSDIFWWSPTDEYPEKTTNLQQVAEQLIYKW